MFDKLLENDINSFFDHESEMKAILEGTNEKPKVKKIKEGAKTVGKMNTDASLHEKKKGGGKFP